jgi:hypothetical protein
MPACSLLRPRNSRLLARGLQSVRIFPSVLTPCLAVNLILRKLADERAADAVVTRGLLDQAVERGLALGVRIGGHFVHPAETRGRDGTKPGEVQSLGSPMRRFFLNSLPIGAPEGAPLVCRLLSHGSLAGTATARADRSDTIRHTPSSQPELTTAPGTCQNGHAGLRSASIRRVAPAGISCAAYPCATTEPSFRTTCTWSPPEST